MVKNDRDSKSWTYLGTDGRSPLGELVRVGSCRHGIEQSLEMAKGDVGLDEYEVRFWLGWHHHMTLSMMALWFVVLEQRRPKKAVVVRVAQIRRNLADLLHRPRTPEQLAQRANARVVATTNRAANTGRGGGVPRCASKSVRQWTDLAPHAHRDELAQFNC